MAKLEGVKVIDMVGGEVTKIAYEGEEYAKVDGVGKAGDIGLRVSNDVSWARLGEYFEMEGSSTCLYYTDNVGDTPAVNQSHWVFFRKTSAQPTLTDRVDELETRVSALEGGGKATENLVGKFAKFNRNGLYVTKGEYYEIVDTDEDGVTIFDDGGDRHWWDYPSDDYEIVDEKPSQVITGDPQVGDKIRIVDAGMTFGDYKNGEIHTVVRLRDDFEKGAVDIDVKNSVYVLREEFEIISRPEKAEEPALKVGDYAKVVEHDNDIYFGGDHTPVGDIVKVVNIREDSPEYYYRVEELNGGNYGHNPNACKDALVPATDEEVAEAKRKLAEKQKAEAEAKKWREIGRKPNEFKAGDIVKLNQGSGAHEKGAIVEVISEDYYRDSEGDTYGGEFEWYDLITPVERRFDR